MPPKSLNSDDLKQLYVGMLRIRMVEEAIAQHYSEQEMRCPVHLSIGQEGVAVGVCEALSGEDQVLSGHRCHAHYLAKRGALKPMLAEIYGKASGCCKGKGGSMHLIDLQAGFLGAAPIVGSTIPIAAGAAFGNIMQGNDGIVVVFFGEGATEEGVLYETLNFASLKKLPILFVCENNFYSVYSPLSVRQPKDRNIELLVRGHGIEFIQGDGNDVEQVYGLTKDAASRIRKTNAPVFLQLTTYRWREHCGPNYDNDIGYRSPSEFEEWKEKCPIANFEAKLTASCVLTPGEIGSIKSEIDAEIKEAFKFAKDSPFPEEGLLLQEVFAA